MFNVTTYYKLLFSCCCSDKRNEKLDQIDILDALLCLLHAVSSSTPHATLHTPPPIECYSVGLLLHTVGLQS